MQPPFTRPIEPSVRSLTTWFNLRGEQRCGDRPVSGYRPEFEIDAFWQLHYWLFDRRGSFTKTELVGGLRELGYAEHQIEEFQRIMQSERTLKLVSADVDEAVLLGLHFTPMIFINGVELKGWNVANAVTGAVFRPPHELLDDVRHFFKL